MNNRFQFFSCIMFVVFLNILIIRCGTSRAQTSIDSLKIVIAEQVDDSVKVLNLMVLANKVRYTQPQEAIKYYKLAYDLASRLNYYPGQKTSLIKLSYIYKSMGKIDSALFYVQNHKVLSFSRNDSSSMAVNHYQHGNLMRVRRKNTLANNYYTESLKLYQLLKDTFGIISVYNCIGILHKNLANFDSAVYYYHKTMDLCRLAGMDNSIGSTLINLGKVYLELADYTNAKKYTEESIEFNEKSNRIDNVGLAYNIMGMIYFEEQKFEEALAYYKKAMSIYKESENMDGMYNLYNNMGNIYKERKEYGKAISNYNVAIQGCQEIEYYPGLISALMNKALVYSIQNRFDDAIVLLDTCLKLTKKTDDNEKRREAYNIIYKTYKRAGQYQKALEFFEKYHFLNDSIYKLEKEEIVADLILKYEKEKDKAKMAELEKETLLKSNQLEKRTNQRNRYLYGGSGILLIFIFFFTYYQQRTRKNRIIAQQRIKQLEEEKKFLAAQSIVEGQEEERRRIAKELHDGLGVLLSSAKIHFATVRDKSPENKPLIDKASKLLEQATHDVRRISHNMMPGLLTQYGLFEAIEGLFDEIDDIKGLNAKIQIEGEPVRLKENTEIMVYRVVQELINNTLKHAEASNIRLQMDIKPDVLNVSYHDDGKGFDLAGKKNTKSIGLNSIVSRVKFLGGDLQIDSKKGKGVKFTFNVPIA